MERSVTLTPEQARELEIAIVGGWGRPAVGPDAAWIDMPGACAGDVVALLDGEQTPVAEVVVADVLNDRARGSITPLRELGHRNHASLRLRDDHARIPSIALVLGDVPADLDLRGADALAVVDRGDAAALARAVEAAQRQIGEERVLVVPSPDETARGELGWENAIVLALKSLVADEVQLIRTERESGDGIVLLLTGLSGSGKSTVAKRLAERLAQIDSRKATLLDGDEVRQVLSSGLGFSKQDRETNIHRIGWVAALIASHGGIAICAPIAPYESMRQDLRAQAERVGRFVLIWVATPLEVCEQRDRKGLYARARRGEIPQFTGISDPYEKPADALVTIDTSIEDIDYSVERILAAMGMTPA